MGTWIATHWFEVLQGAGIIGALVLNVASLREQTTSRRVSNLIKLTQQHREIWKEYMLRPELSRIRTGGGIDLEKAPVTKEEETFVKFIIVHLNSVYRASQLDRTAAVGNFAQDVGVFFSLPVPSAVWERFRAVQAQDFARFVEDSRASFSAR